jgi:hypothetical protein
MHELGEGVAAAPRRCVAIGWFTSGTNAANQRQPGVLLSLFSIANGPSFCWA